MIKIYKKASDLPDTWRYIFIDNGYISKENLTILESCNPCNQRYVIINDRSAFVVYQLKLNILSYSSMRFDLKVNIIGLPCSVSKRGYHIEEEDLKELEDFIIKEKSSYIILNSDHSFLSRKFIVGETLPTCRLQVLWDTFQCYLQSLRSHYRYRINKAIKKGQDLTIKKLEDNCSFDDALYALYEQVYEKSEYKLEKLGIDFFRKLDTDIYVFYVEGKAAAFVQLYGKEKELTFVFGGLDYALNSKYDLYMNMLVFILRLGIENKYSFIEMGQTAEDAKMKLGCKQYKKYMHIYHSNSFIRMLIRLLYKSLVINL